MADLTSARMSYAAAICGTMFYGVYVVLSGICIHFLVEHRRKTRAQRVILGYTVAMLIVSTIYFVCAVKWSEVEFVEATEDIGLFATLLTSQLAIVKDTAYTVNIWLADSLLIYRLFVIFNGRTYVIAIPCLLWLGTIATGIGLLYVTANGHSLLANLTVQFQLAFYGCSVAINVITTLLIAGKLWYQERTMRRYKAHGLTTHYPVIAIVIESAALYSVLGVIFMPLVARKTPSSLVLSALIGSFTTIAPTLIILRIARGVAATSNSINTSAMTSGNGDVKLSTFRAQRSDGSRGSTTLGGTQYTPFSSSMSVPSPGEAWKDDKFASLAAHPADNILNV